MRSDLLPEYREPGTFQASDVREGSRYELVDGHPLYRLPASGSLGRYVWLGTMVLGADPEVEEVGTDVGYTARPKSLRAPDIAVGNVPDRPGWVPGAPRLAVEYADRGQDEADLQEKIQEFLSAGTEAIWVVRLVGPRRVEVYTREGPIRVYTAGEELRAPGILRNPVPVEALYNRDAALDTTLRNLLQRHGYDSLDAVRAEGHAEGQAEGRVSGLRDALRQIAAARGWALSPAQQDRLRATSESATLERWLTEAALAQGPDDLVSA